MKVSPIIISVLIVSAILMGMGSFYSDLFVNADMELNDTGSISKMSEMSEKIEGPVKGNATATGGTLEEIVYFLKAGVNSFGVLITFPAIIIEMMLDATGILGPATGGFPFWFTSLLSAVIWSIFVFTLISILVKKDV